MTHSIRLAAAMIAAACVYGSAALAQQAGTGCTSSQPTGGPQTLRCGGVTIIAENGARFTLLDRDHNGRVDGVDLQSKAVFIEASKQKAGKTFEVMTPQAIAAVRGTRWAVDAEGSKTSVFVETGRVGVRHVTGRGSVTLSPGEGVDVDASATPLEIKRWPAPRVAALMARLGR
ncbi:FecR family protein [Bradyrhizobium sp. NFR13]|uniref:FecR domain-containing protein n=1 Tax=Bradyrhizobium sp. NFR13 TaxID=1566285 RepID=UPI0008EB62EC|nr:FecR family protein [Bradyrhizobium sp. NFR13]SFL25320.1 FecR family protein [Bradyrhizobium sp. NFR13]